MSNMEKYKRVGFNLDIHSGTYYQTVKGYDMCVTSSGRNQVLTVSVTKDDKYPDLNEIKSHVKSSKSVVNVSSQGYRLSFAFKVGVRQKKSDEYLQDGMNYVLDFLVENGYVNCCESCGSTGPTGIYYVGGTARILCEEHYREACERVVELKQNHEEKKENIVGGIVGAFLGSLLGVIMIVIFAQLGFVAIFTGVIMGICTVKGYELLGRKVTKRGLVISIFIMLGMCYFANRMNWAVTIARQLEWNVFDSFVECEYVVGYVDLKVDYIKDLVLILIYTLGGAIPYAISALTTTNRSMESYVLKETNKEE